MSAPVVEQTAEARGGIGQGSEPLAVKQVREAAEALLAEGKLDEAVEVMLAALAAVVRKSRELELLVAKLRREAVGKRSERLDLGQLSLLFEELAEASPAEVDAEAEAREEAELDREVKQAEEEKAKTQSETRRRRRGGVRPNVSEVQVHHHQVPPEQRACEGCGEEQERIGEDVSYRLEFVPGHFIQHEHHLEKLACPKCKDGVTTAAGVPQVIERSQAEPSLLAHLVVSKYEDHCPLHRLSGIYERSGVEIAVSTLADWTAAVADRLQPLVGELERRAVDAFLIRTDATGIKVLDRTASENVQRGTFWAYVLDDLDVVFRYAPTGEGETGPWEFLAGCTGYVQADAASVFDRVFNGKVGNAVEVGCWAHARRKLVELEDTDLRVAYPLKLIARLYRLEHLADARELEPPERRLLRQERSAPVLERLKGWIAIALCGEPPKSSLAQALRYFDNHWQALTRFLQDGRLELDNNLCERQMRSIALGRRNYLFCGSDEAARRAATLYSLLRTCALRGVPPLPYLTDVLTKLAAGWPQERVAELLPDRWQVAPAPQAALA